MEKGKGSHLRTDVSQGQSKRTNQTPTVDFIVPNAYRPVKRLSLETVVCTVILAAAALYLAGHVVAAILSGRIP